MFQLSRAYNMNITITQVFYFFLLFQNVKSKTKDISGATNLFSQNLCCINKLSHGIFKHTMSLQTHIFNIDSQKTKLKLYVHV